MRCEQQKKCYLYYFKELTGSEKRVFKKHVKECEYCQLELDRINSVWKELEELPLEQPSSKISKNIIKSANQQREKSGFLSSISGWFSFSLFEYRKPLRIAAAVSALVLLIFLSPLNKKMFSNLGGNSFSDWNDNFITKVNQIEVALDRIESSDLYSELESIDSEDEIITDDDWTSPLMKEINTIRESIKYINEI